MPLELPSLPYGYDALSPVISAQSLGNHHRNVHGGYIERLKALGHGDFSLESIMLTMRGEAHACACQAWNHTFLWQCLTPWYQTPAEGPLQHAVMARWGSFEALLQALHASAGAHFMGGWTWLVVTAAGRLDIINAADAGSPLLGGYHPLLAIDMWEHAWVPDYLGDRHKYLDRLETIINWPFVEQCFDDAVAAAQGRRPLVQFATLPQTGMPPR
ncbi:superoxide dismutase [Kushneria aurantia]|uniref:Superoxide dismutase n=1 Tax=Kushneria aurantia TaxID=504092 RepID=A0ABV6G607_9GAMM|nr:superoxide dismutase [Kushneria aurantia]